VFEEYGIGFHIAQWNVSFNKTQGTLRGMHYQLPPYEEIKLVQCVRGAVVDVVIDLRPDSPTFCQWISANLMPENQSQMFVPPGCAHGYLTLDDNVEVMYLVSEFYHPECARGVRWDDPRFQIDWPIQDNLIINDRDAKYPDFEC
jgi:dTDP-4-dehydrorhamnose 3,5-epimerase